MKRIRQIVNKMGMRLRLIFSFGVVLLVAMLGTTLSMNFYNRRFIRSLLEQNNTQKMQEINYELNSLYDKINQVFISYNSQKFYEMFVDDPEQSAFDKMKEQLAYEQEIKAAVNANYLRSAILGNIFYISQQHHIYVGNGVMQKGFPFWKAEWYQIFQEQGGKLTYGPLTEDFRSQNSTKKEAVYYLREWNVPDASGMKTDETPFILFSIDMDYIREILERYFEDTRGFIVTDETGNFLFSMHLEEAQVEKLTGIIEENRNVLSATGTCLNKEWFISGMSNKQFGWQIYSMESTENIFRDMNHIIRNVNLIILGTGVAALILTVLFSSRIMMPITLLNKLISTIEEENDTFIQVMTHDELGQIGRRFNQMKRKIQEMSANVYLSRVQEKEAQLSALQSQINPHFLYNTLDNIYCIAQIEEVDMIVQLTENLSNMMRYSMDMKKHNVALEKEMDHARAYVNIINIRFDDSICLEFSVKEEWKNIPILKLTLQPLVENAWNHGLLPKEGHKGHILISVEGEEQDLVVTVTDDGVGITRERSEEMNRSLAKVDYGATASAKGFGVALKNVNNRIKLSDGPEYGITLFPQEGGGCRVIVRMKLRKPEEKS